MGNALTSQVTCYAGSTYPEHPRTFRWQDQDYSVQEVIYRWRTPMGLGFYVRCVPENALFNLFYNIQQDTWQIKPGGYDRIIENPQPKADFQGD